MSHKLILSSIVTALGLISILALLQTVKFSSVKLSEITNYSRGLNIESKLALGYPISLSECEVPDLEMIPKIGPALAQKLISNRSTLLLRARTMRNPEFALITIKGIGPLKAEKIGSRKINHVQ